MIQMAVEQGPRPAADLKIGICGEQGGDPASVEFCFRSGLNYVSCCPVPRADRPAGRGAGRHQGEEVKRHRQQINSRRLTASGRRHGEFHRRLQSTELG